MTLPAFVLCLPRLSEALAKHREACQVLVEKISRSTRENKILTALESRGSEAEKQKAIDAVRIGYNESVGICFADKNHVKIIVKGAMAIANTELIGVSFTETIVMNMNEVRGSMDIANFISNVLGLANLDEFCAGLRVPAPGEAHCSDNGSFEGLLQSGRTRHQRRASRQ